MNTLETPMSSNVPVTVGATTGGENNFLPESSGQVRVPAEQEVKPDNGPQDEVQISEKILLSAKEEGFEEALTHLANGDFETAGDSFGSVLETEANEPNVEVEDMGPTDFEQEEKIEESSANEKNTSNEKAAPIVDGEVEGDEKNEVVVEKIRELESQVTGLEEKNKELFEKVQNLENNNTLALQALLEMTMVLREMLKEEDNSEKKVPLLQSLVNLMTSLMIAMFVPDGEKALQQTAKNVEKQEVVRRGSKRKSMEEAIRILRSRGTIRPEGKATQAPAQNEAQMQAA